MSEVVVWFTGGCPLCRREIALMRRLDRRGAVRFVDVADPAASCPVSPADALAWLHAEEEVRLVSGAAASAATWRAIPSLRPLGLLARQPRVLGALERLYRVFLHLRPGLRQVLRHIESAGLRP